MTVTEIKQSIGSFEVRLREDTPRHLLNALTFFGHVAVMPGRLNPLQYGDNLLQAARYVGVYRGRDAQNTFTLKGSGLAFWLGDEDNKGDVFETAVVLTADTFADSVTALLPPGGAVVAGTINAVAGTYTGRHQWQTSREALTYVADTFDAEWRMNGDATLDAGTVTQLYGTTPRAILLPKGWGADLQRKALPGKASMGVDVEDTTTRVVLLAEGEGTNIVTGDADAPATPYRDLRGNPIKMTRIVSESETSSGNATARAQLQLNRFLNARRSVSLTSSEYDIKGTFGVGEYLDVYDPDNGFYDAAREVNWQGDRINPMALRCVEMTWPIPEGWTVAFRDLNGAWWDLSAYYVPEGGETTIVVGELARGLASVGGEAIGIRPNLPVGDGDTDTTIPGIVTFGDFSTGSYQSPTDGWTKAVVLATWIQPLNGDGSTVLDGDHYELQYRVNTFIGYQVRWGQLATYRWGGLAGNRWGAPITSPIDTADEWHSIFVPWDQIQFMVQELTPGVEYEFRVRAVDLRGQQGPWSTSEFIVASGDLFSPSTPAAPVVAASMVALQVVHTLGKASGGTFNLEPDLVYLSVHLGTDSGFQPEDGNQIGKLVANGGMIQAGIPAVGTFQVDHTDIVWVKVVAVDSSGNKSSPSAAVQQTVELIDDAHISNLTVSKVTAGTISATWINAGRITTADTGRRVELDGDGVKTFNADGHTTIQMRADEGRINFYEPGFAVPPLEIGETSAGGYGMRVSDLFNDTKVLIGQLDPAGGFATENYGIALQNPAGELVKLENFIFGPTKNIKSSVGSTASTTFTDLSDGTGPQIAGIIIGDTGRAIVTLSAYMEPASGDMGLMGVEITDEFANLTQAAAELDSLSLGGGSSSSLTSVTGRASVQVFVDGLAPGWYAFTAKYKVLGLGTGLFANRIMVVQPY